MYRNDLAAGLTEERERACEVAYEEAYEGALMDYITGMNDFFSSFVTVQYDDDEVQASANEGAHDAQIEALFTRLASELGRDVRAVKRAVLRLERLR